MQIRKGGQNKIANKFRSFYINKMNVEDYSKARSKRNAEPGNPVIFKKKPYVSAVSKKLASNARNKLDNKGDQHDIVEHLYAKEKTRQAMKDRMVADAILDAANREDGAITGKPKILDYPLAAEKTSGDKCYDLFKRVKEG